MDSEMKRNIFLKPVTDDLNYWLIITHADNKFCTEKGWVIVIVALN